MPRTVMITDTDASIPLALSEMLSIRQVPINIQFGEESLRAVYDIDDATTFSRIDTTGKLPPTSAPSPGQFAQKFKHAIDQGADSILCFTLSSEVSATCAAAVTASNDFPGQDITVVDTRSLSMGQGFQVFYAAEALQRGTSMDEAATISKSVGNRTHF